MGGLVARSTAVDAVDAVLGAAAAGQGGLLTVSGPAGVGRTAVLGAAAEHAASAGFVVLAAGAGPFDREAGLGLIRRALLPLVDEHPDLLDAGPPAWATPVFRPEGGDVDHLAVSYGILALLDRACDVLGPTALVLDDVDRADVGSLRVLAEVAGAARDLRLALIVSHLGGAQAPGLGHLVSRGGTVELEPFGLDAIQDLGAERLGRPFSAGEAEAVRSASLGLPAVLIPLLDAIEAGGSGGALPVDVAALEPAPLHGQVAARLDAVSAEARSLALATSVLGDGARMEVVGAAAALGAARVGPAVAELVDAGLFASGARPGWAVPLLAKAARRVVGEGAASQISVRAAAAMAAAQDPAAEVASLLMGTPAVGEPWAAIALASAAGEAEARGAPDVAKDLWLRQLEEPLDVFGRGWATAAVARAEMHLGDPAGADRLDALAPLVDDPGLRARVRFAAGRAFLWNAEPERAAGSFGAAADDAAIAGEDEIHRRSLTGELLSVAIGSLGDDRVAELASAFPELDGTASSSSLRCAQAMAALVASVDSGADADVILGLARAGVDDDRLYVLPTSDYTALTSATFALVAAGAPDEAIDVLERVIASGHQLGQLATVATVSASRASALIAAGRISEAVDAAELALGADHTWPIERPAAAAALAEAHRLRGDLDRAVAALAEHPVDEAAAPVRTAELQWLVVAARIALDAGDPHLAERRARRALASGELGAAVGADLVLARALVASGATAEATALLEQLATRGGRPPAHAGSLQVLLGRIRSDGEQLAHGVELLRSGSSPVELVDGLVALGHEHLRTGQRAIARDVFREALGLADSMGTKGQAEVAIDGLRLAGGRPRRQALTGAAALTPGEERICRLVAAGRSNREVAEVLFVSRKTVEYHLGNAYGKLGITRREQLAAVLGGDQPAPTQP